MNNLAASIQISRAKQRNKLQIAVQKWLRIAAKQIMEDLKVILKAEGDAFANLIQWDIIETKGEEILFPSIQATYLAGKNAASRHMGIRGAFDIYDFQAVEAARTLTSNLITNVTATTKLAVSEQIAVGIENGLSMAQVAKEIRPLVGLTPAQATSVRDLAEKLVQEGVAPDRIERMVGIQSKKKLIARTNTIARTETARAQSLGYVERMKSLGQERLEVLSSGGCELCESLAGVYAVEEAREIIPIHPNCRCILLPVV